MKYLPTLQRSTNYAFVAIDRARYVFVEILPNGREHCSRLPQALPRRLPARRSRHPDRQRRWFNDLLAIEQKNKPPAHFPMPIPLTISSSNVASHIVSQSAAYPRPAASSNASTGASPEAKANDHKETWQRSARLYRPADRDAFIAKSTRDDKRIRLSYLVPVQAVANHIGLNRPQG
ncbi:hypothetical protein [Bradyrhizobium brasilense]|uniref:hypothetical protein n=1 Tax=Bradyrhizobium brasilense TaxID=1419277 RepID=UPI003B968328